MRRSARGLYEEGQAMNTPKRAASRAGWRVLAAAPAMTGSLLLLVFLSGGIAP
jgi:hypothetical protein